MVRLRHLAEQATNEAHRRARATGYHHGVNNLA